MGVYRYEWDALKFGTDFAITPTKGYISPGMEVPFEINFHPTVKCDDIRIEVLCVLSSN